MESLNEDFQAALLIYDEGILGNDQDLANAVWRRFFVKTPDPDYEKIETLVRYIRRTMSVLDNTDLKSLLSKQIKWLPLKES